MGEIVIYHQSNRLACTLSSHEGTTASADCAKSFSLLESGHDAQLVCSARDLIHYCRTRYTMVRAAGGVVSLPNGRRLLMRREGMWDLPKGMVETGETLSVAALREVQEETGIAARLSMRKPLIKTYHIYNKYGGWHLKQTTWFAMSADDGSLPVPQRDEGIDQVGWLKPSEWKGCLLESFASLRQVARRIEN